MLTASSILKKNDLDITFTLSNILQERLDNILEQARKKVSSLKFPGEAIDEIPNDPLSAEKSIKPEDIYFDDSLKQMLAPENLMIFSQPSTDDRRDFEVNVGGDKLIPFKSPALTTASVAKKDLKNALEKITEDLDLNLKQVQMKNDDRQETKQKINLVKNLLIELIRKINKTLKNNFKHISGLQN